MGAGGNGGRRRWRAEELRAGGSDGFQTDPEADDEDGDELEDSSSSSGEDEEEAEERDAPPSPVSATRLSQPRSPSPAIVSRSEIERLSVGMDIDVEGLLAEARGRGFDVCP